MFTLTLGCPIGLKRGKGYRARPSDLGDFAAAKITRASWSPRGDAFAEVGLPSFIRLDRYDFIEGLHDGRGLGPELRRFASVSRVWSA